MSFSAGTAEASIRIPFKYRRIAPLLRRLSEYMTLSDAACEALGRWDHLPVRTVEPKHDLVRQGDHPAHMHLIKKGWACRYKILPNGRRQITDFPIPGDLCDLNIFILSRLDHSIGAITSLEVVEIRLEDFEAVIRRHGEILQALCWQQLVSNAACREWVVSLGARNALERIAHLLCETFVRLECIGETDGSACPFPLTQQDLGDATGLTSVHVNRSLQELRRLGLIELGNRALTIVDMKSLKKLGQFNADYMHLKRLERRAN